MLVLRHDRAMPSVVEVKLARQRNISRNADRLKVGA